MRTELVLRASEWSATALLAGLECRTHSSAVRTQAAVLRTLIDELERLPDASTVVFDLREQLAEEMNRLVDLLRATAPLGAA